MGPIIKSLCEYKFCFWENLIERNPKWRGREKKKEMDMEALLTLSVDGIVQQIRAGENEKALEKTRSLLLKYENQKDVLGLLFELSFRLHYLLGNIDSAYRLAYYCLTSYENLGDNWRMRFADSYMVAGKLFTMTNSKEFSFKVPCDHLKLAFDLYAHALKYADEVPDYLEGGKYADENIQLKFKILEQLLTGMEAT